MYEQFIILPIDICRICSNLQSNSNILTETLGDENVLLHEALEFVSCIKVDFNDGMSQTMCSTCTSKLSDAYEFKNQVLDSYRTFYNQTSDLNFKEENDENDSELLVDGNSSIELKKQLKIATNTESVNNLGIPLSSHAVSFLLEHNNCKTRKETPELPKEQNQTALEKEGVKNEEEEYEVYILPDTPTQSEENEQPSTENKEDEHFELCSKDSNQPNHKESPSSEKENNNTSLAINVKTNDRKRTLSDRENENSISFDDMEPQTDENPKHSCHICYKTLARKSSLDVHLRIHANERNFVCPFCQKAFVQLANYRMHLRVHTKEKPFPCYYCGKSFSQSSSLKVHMRSHTNEKNYLCQVCCKGFTNSSDLEKHERVHDINRQFECKICGNFYAQKANLRAHEKKVHY
ncbi:zinc finger protein 26-like [Episyrphus balteatus]|uniref:zinc finger protein 26-like n=1 Tax=Episyrphus balteatus TaxID=286459 RepID=UPI00248555B3|nr:zinc finger protein 26-like [Episyrphus balteatus]